MTDKQRIKALEVAVKSLQEQMEYAHTRIVELNNLQTATSAKSLDMRFGALREAVPGMVTKGIEAWIGPTRIRDLGPLLESVRDLLRTPKAQKWIERQRELEEFTTGRYEDDYE